MLGFHVTPVIAVEGNFEYAGFDLHSLSGTASVSGGAATSVNASLQGRFDTYNGLVNAIWTPLGPAGRYGISPYIGAGVGFSHINETLTAVTVAGTTFTGSLSGDETDFAANGIVGADFPIPLVPQLTAGVRYRLLFVNTGSSNSAISNGNFIGHVFTANATWHF
jgi:opacity protein-like surface antigen